MNISTVSMTVNCVNIMMVLMCKAMSMICITIVFCRMCVMFVIISADVCSSYDDYGSGLRWVMMIMQMIMRTIAIASIMVTAMIHMFTSVVLTMMMMTVMMFDMMMCMVVTVMMMKEYGCECELYVYELLCVLSL